MLAPGSDSRSTVRPTPPVSRPVAVVIFLAAAAGAIGVQASVATGASVPDSIRIGARSVVAGAIVALVVGVAAAMVRGERPRDGTWPRITVVAALACLLAAALMARAPSRLAANGLALAVWIPAVWWVVARRAGQQGAANALLALSAFTLVASTADRRNTRFIEDYHPGSAFRWGVGWPTRDWALRYEIHLDAPAPARAAVFRVPLAHAYQGPARLEATLNGSTLGAARHDGDMEMSFPISRATVAGLTDLAFELRLPARDLGVVAVAQPWSGGASLRSAASSYFDGTAWHRGTYDEATGRPQAGLYAVRFEYTE
jgi:hypothetical protein